MNTIKICFISRIQTKKNLKYAIECLNGVDKNIEVYFDIYGPSENEIYFNDSLRTLKYTSKNIFWNYKGILTHDEIINTIMEYDLFFLPTLSENFGHIIYEALVANVPILISDQTPWNDINDYFAGSALPLDNQIGFVQYIEKVAKLNFEEIDELRENVKKYLENKINLDEIQNEYLDIFNSVIKINEGS
ncbi:MULTISPECIES: glycosyltransferase [unclassified Facklamia]|uniref:glycosyltransferase n=1 Tax=Aerococcaceae TaxID=186827 RepID=UPI0013B76D42|nr:glycosyltransferase [Aerococcaceae bacterium zg-B36]NEW65056.1 glycosyltransferase [Facklamia sp. 252]NEW68713.1 glycosyltransferase [Facklamia sp. 253]QQD66530.1 glycosyltransferase [Aerococcaceae bacterium zg-252]